MATLEGLSMTELQTIQEAMYNHIAYKKEIANSTGNPQFGLTETEISLNEFIKLQVKEQETGGAWKRRIREQGHVI